MPEDTMMPPPPELGGRPSAPAAPYSEPRGTCPSCGSEEVTHLIIGMPARPDDGAGDPAWVAWVGCVHPGHTRSCESCGATWTPVPTYDDLASLMAEADVEALDDLCGWMSEDYDLDAWVVTGENDADYFEVGFGDTSEVIEFPIAQDTFWDTLDRLHKDVAASIESDDT